MRGSCKVEPQSQLSNLKMSSISACDKFPVKNRATDNCRRFTRTLQKEQCSQRTCNYRRSSTDLVDFLVVKDYGKPNSTRVPQSCLLFRAGEYAPTAKLNIDGAAASVLTGHWTPLSQNHYLCDESPQITSKRARSKLVSTRPLCVDTGESFLRNSFGVRIRRVRRASIQSSQPHVSDKHFT